MAVPFIAPMNYGRAKTSRPHRFAYDYGSVDPGMYAPAPDRTRPKRAPKRTLAYSIPLPDERSSEAANATGQGHILGVNALALTKTSGKTGGQLISGGRDGVVKVWDLNIPQQSCQAGDEWTIDHDKIQQQRPNTVQRASHQVHADWINDVVAVNGGRTAITASSDQTVQAWTPGARPHLVGSHMDYVKALAYSEHRNSVISGGLDRQIRVWDVAETRSGPICALGGMSGALSVYTLACNVQGSLVISGSPEKTIRVWDIRDGRPLTALTGHTDHIRAVLLSEDSELVLSASSDSTVKLWSMRMRRCLSTFTQHSDSVWALSSTHPRFHTFYSASRDGLVAKTVGAGMGEDLVACVAVAKESQGVVKLAALDYTYIWTATRGTRLNRWLDVDMSPQKLPEIAQQSRLDAGSGFALESEHTGHRRNRTLDSAHMRPMSSTSGAAVSPVIIAMQAEQVRRGAAHEADGDDQYYDAHSRPTSNGENPSLISEVLATSGSGNQAQLPAPISIPGSASKAEATTATATSHAPAETTGISKATTTAPSIPDLESVVPICSEPDESICGRHGLHRHLVLPNRRHVLAQDTAGRISLWDILLCRRIHEFPDVASNESCFPGIGGRDFDTVAEAMAADPESVNSWCHIDTRTGVLTVHLSEGQVWDAEVHVDEVEGVPPEAIRAMGDHERVNIGQWMLKRLFLPYARARVKRGLLSSADAALLNRWAAQVPAAEVVPARAVQRPNAAFTTPATQGAILSVADNREDSQLQPSVVSPLEATTVEIGLASQSKSRADSSGSTSSDAHNPVQKQQHYQHQHQQQIPRHQHNPSIDTAQSTTQTTPSATQTVQTKAEDGESSASNGSAGKFISRLRSMRVRKQKSNLATSMPLSAKDSGTAAGSSVPPLPTTPNKPIQLPENTRSTSAPGIVANTAPDPQDTFNEWAGTRYPTDTERTLSLLQNQPAPWEQLYSAILCPRLPLPRGVCIMVYQSCPDASDPFVLFRSTFESLCSNANEADGEVSTESVFRIIDDALLSFELCMPAWLTDFMLFNRLPASFQEPSKVSFVLSPAASTTLPPFPNPGARLVANRMLRARKLAIYVVDKLGLNLLTQPAPNYVGAVDSCVQSYKNAAGEANNTDAATSGAVTVDYAAVFERAGEKLSDIEREALADVSRWRELQHIRSSGQESSNEYVGRPELYLYLTCKGKGISSKTTLATIKANMWRSGSDVVVHYEWAEFVRQRIAKAQALAS
ncbi:hypothetical protein IWW36_001170 [Coemansia brasiliensis]|uniref:WD40 repeat-like protein n=1 Tax=Coemansia brasiliensis TaxID=2650707 RepID=A0A9W8IA45_9FUNG|nr:hypothetical protein IWW36_001170 [Coemansia brasiliensis]